MRSHHLTDAPTTVTGRDGKTYPTSKPRKPVVEVAGRQRGDRRRLPRSTDQDAEQVAEMPDKR